MGVFCLWFLWWSKLLSSCALPVFDQFPVPQDKPGHRESKEDPDSVSTTPNIFSFYNYLRTHPLLLRLRLASTSLKQRRAILTGQRGLEDWGLEQTHRLSGTWIDGPRHMRTSTLPSSPPPHEHTCTFSLSVTLSPPPLSLSLSLSGRLLFMCIMCWYKYLWIIIAAACSVTHDYFETCAVNDFCVWFGL